MRICFLSWIPSLKAPCTRPKKVPSSDVTALTPTVLSGDRALRGSSKSNEDTNVALVRLTDGLTGRKGTAGIHREGKGHMGT